MKNLMGVSILTVRGIHGKILTDVTKEDEKMVPVTHHPKLVKNCAFCKYWLGDAQMTFVNGSAGYRYDSSAKGKCTKRSGATTPTPAIYQCRDFAPNRDAERLL